VATEVRAVGAALAAARRGWGGGKPLPYFLVLLAATSLFAQDRAIPFWPDAVPSAIHAEVDGVAALETVRELGRFHRVQGSPGFAAAAELMKRKAVAAGLSDAAIERFPADGKTKYAHFLSHVGWTPVSATLEEVEPRQRLIESFPDLPVALADYSQDANVTAALVDVGRGTSPADYEGKDVRGKIVLADGPLPTVHRLACEERGAAGFLSDFPNQATPWSGDDRDLIRWGHLSPYQPNNRFAFMISKRQAAELRERLASGARVVLRARVDAKMVPATYDVVVATIPGTDPSAGEVVVTAHLCHESAGANDNASGSAAILEVARALAAAIRRQTLAPPRRTIRFLWLPEITGSQAYLVRHPEVVARLVGGLHMDMVGGLLATTKGTFHVSRTAETLPHVANVVAEAWFDQVVAASQRYAEGMNPTGYAEGTGDAYAGFVWPPGSREMLLGDVRGINMGSDHEVFQAGGFRVPMVYFHDYPDITIHSQKDQPENLDATKLGRVAYLGAGVVYTLAALPDSEVPRLLALARVDGEERILRASLVTGPDAAVTRREAIRSAIGTLESVAKLWPSAAPAVAADVQRLRAELPAAPAAPADRRVPTRSPDIIGPINVYYYDYFADIPGADFTKTALARRDDGDILAYEALNLADGTRSISEIRDVLSGRYASIPLAAIAEYFELLARAGAVSLR
jgi:aminopeptidase YwaD